MKKTLILGTVLLAALIFSGCATLLGGGGQQIISVNSDSEHPMKATLSYEDGSSLQHISIPGTTIVQRKAKDIKIVSKDNEFQPVTVDNNLNAAFVANILGFGFFPLSSTTDAASGAMWKYDEIVTVHTSKNEQYDSKKSNNSRQNRVEDNSNDNFMPIK